MWGAAALWAGPCDGTADYLYGVVEIFDEILDDGQLLEVLLPEVCL